MDNHRYPIHLIQDDLTLPAELAGREGDCLFLEPHPQFPRQWVVNSFDARYRNRMGDVIGRYRSVSAFAFDKFAQRAEEQGYHIVFLEDPKPVFDWLHGLHSDPEVSIVSTLPGTFRGLLPFQIQGINFAKNQRANVLQWSTGSGKAVGAAALIKYHRNLANFDLCLYVVKSHNKINTQRSLETLVEINSLVLDGTPSKRSATYEAVRQAVSQDERPVLIMHYETFRNDKDTFVELVENRRVLVIFDEMPTKLKNRATSLYKAVCEVFYKKKSKRSKVITPRVGCERPSQFWSVMLSATPIENNPEDWFNCVHLLDPSIYKSVSAFRENFVAHKNQWGVPTAWKDIDRMGAMAAHITHQVDKRDPDISKQFPKVMPPETVYVALHPRDKMIYDALATEYERMIAKDESMLRDIDLLGAINVLQMICSNPMSVLHSADRYAEYAAERNAHISESMPSASELESWEKKHKRGSEVAYKLVERIGRTVFGDMDGNEIRCSKLQALKDDLELHDGKAIVFTRMNESLLPLISNHLTSWGINHVVFHGGLSMNQKQERQDSFKQDPEVKVFLSSDSGSDSINLQEADLVIHYDWPWKWSTLEQRQNRCHRITSKFGSVQFKTLSVPNSVEDRTQEIVALKEGYHNQAFKGEIAEQAMEMRRSDLIYILTGKRKGEDGV